MDHFENLINRVRNIVGYETDGEAAERLNKIGVTPEEAFLAITAAKLMNKWAEEPLPTGHEE